MKGKENIVVYVNSFLPYSETFVYNQIIFLENYFAVTVVCETLLEGNFSFDSVIVLPKENYFLRRINTRLYTQGEAIISKKKKRAFRDLVHSLKPKFVVAHFGNNGMILNRYLEGEELRRIIFIHGYDGSQLLFKSKTYAESFIQNSQLDVCKFLFVSHGLKAVSEKILEKKISGDVFYLGIDPSEFKRENYNVEPNQFIQVSSFNEKKGHLNLLKAILLLNDKNKFHFKFIGDGPLLEDCKKFVEQNSLQKLVSFLGKKTSQEIIQELNTSRYFIHPSITAKDYNSEGLPISILEAMAMEMPIISTIHSGIPEAVTNNVNGLLVEENNIKELSLALGKISSWDFLPANREKVIQKFNIEKTVKGLASF